MARPKLEVCVDSVASARAAAAGTADRIELCSSLAVGGITPSWGLIEACCHAVDLPVMVMIRPGEGSFCYTDDQLSVMQRDVQRARQLQVAGVVLGTLDRQGGIDRDALARLVELAQPLEVTFHRAFDLVADQHQALEQLVELGVTRVLTSGAAATALEGAARLASLCRQAGGRITILPGGGIRPENVAQLLRDVPAWEVHASARSAPAQPPGSVLVQQLAASDPPVCSTDMVRALVAALAAARPEERTPATLSTDFIETKVEYTCQEGRHGAQRG